MIATTIPFPQVAQLAKTDIAYGTLNPDLSPFYKFEPHLENFKAVIEAKKSHDIDRGALVEVLKEQYHTLGSLADRAELIDRLASDHTFTVATAHQPCLMMGPLYFIYKIVSTINLAASLKSNYPEYNFVPIFVIGGEDHDFDEINHINLFNRTITWEATDGGPVGLYSTGSMAPVLEELRNLLGTSENAAKILTLLSTAYTQFEGYFEATQYLIDRFFKEHNLLVINMYHPTLKARFVEVMQDELLHQSSKKIIDGTIENLVSVGYKNQAFPREINLFYIQKGLRERIVLEEEVYKVLNTDLVFTKDEIIAELKQFPNHFSPNVVLRPLFQEQVLPNLAYIGGGGEIAYWLERKAQFEWYNIPYPMLVRRSSVVWVDKESLKKLHKAGLQFLDLFQDLEVLIKRFVHANTTENLSVAGHKAAIEDIYQQIKDVADTIDPTISNVVMAELNKQLAVLDQLEGRLIRGSKQKHEVVIQQIRNLHQKFFPNNGLQERFDNFIPFYLKYGDEFLTELFKHLHPLTPGFLILEETV